MFKSIFSKYLTAFVVIVFVCFLMLSSIITSMVRSSVTDDKAEKLEDSSLIISSMFADNNIEQLDKYIESSSIDYMISLVSINYNFDVLITDDEGGVLLSTLILTEEGLPSTRGDLGTVSAEDFDISTNSDGESFLTYRGILSGVSDEAIIAYGREIVTAGVTRGYVFSLVSTAKEDALVGVVRTAVFNSSLWIMLAAVIATYFITERITRPLKGMISAAKKFAKGDFSERVSVRGSDEVAELSAALNNMAESLDSLETMRNSFLANVSHDLRTPMTTISGFIDGITSGAIPPEQHNHYLGVISSEVHRLSRLVSQLLDISRLESGDRKFNFADFDVAEVCRLIIISFEKSIEEKKLDVDFVTEDESVMVNADKDSIYQVLYNLCHNAIKFSHENGRFIIKISRLPAKKICVSIYDDGQIISQDDAAHIFDRFYKTDKSRGLDKNGVGLGLYICKTIIDAHNEQIRVSPHTEGCEFWFTLKEGASVPKHKAHDE